MAVPNGATVRVHYRGTLEDGSEFDSSAGREPLEFTVGAGQVIPGFDRAVAGLEEGSSTTITIPAEEAYGERHESAVQTVPREMFYGDPYEGAQVTVASPEGDEMRAVITSVEDDDVTLDFNHPLAGEALTFEIELVEVLSS